MGELTVGEHASNYKPVNQETAKALQEKAGPSTASMLANKAAKASLVASVALFVASIFGHGPAEVGKDIASGTVDAASDFAGGTRAAGERLNENIKFHLGDPNQPDTNPQAPKK